MTASPLKKSIIFASSAVVALSLFFLPSSALADNHHNDHHKDRHNDHRDHHEEDTPRLFSIENISAHSAVLSFQFKKLKNKTATARVSIKNNKDDHSIMEKLYSVKLNDDGKGSVTVGNLMSGTRYEFKIALKKSNGNFTDNSNSKDAKTK